jgi:hypothetical protein
MRRSRRSESKRGTQKINRKKHGFYFDRKLAKQIERETEKAMRHDIFNRV